MVLVRGASHSHYYASYLHVDLIPNWRWSTRSIPRSSERRGYCQNRSTWTPTCRNYGSIARGSSRSMFEYTAIKLNQPLFKLSSWTNPRSGAFIHCICRAFTDLPSWTRTTPKPCPHTPYSKQACLIWPHLLLQLNWFSMLQNDLAWMDATYNPLNFYQVPLTQPKTSNPNWPSNHLAFIE
jgi:hypothetical protein